MTVDYVDFTMNCSSGSQVSNGIDIDITNFKTLVIFTRSANYNVIKRYTGGSTKMLEDRVAATSEKTYNISDAVTLVMSAWINGNGGSVHCRLKK